MTVVIGSLKTSLVTQTPSQMCENKHPYQAGVSQTIVPHLLT